MGYYYYAVQSTGGTKYVLCLLWWGEGVLYSAIPKNSSLLCSRLGCLSIYRIMQQQ
jgi:hypothetical protein